MIERAPAEDAGTLPPWATLDPGTPDDAGVPDADWVHQHQAELAQMTQGDTGPAGPPADPRVDFGAPMPSWADDVGGAFSALGTNVRAKARDLAYHATDPIGGADELMKNSYDVPEGAAGLLLQKGVHALTGVAGREEQEADKRIKGDNLLEDLGTIGAINREATGRAPAELQTAKAIAEAGTWAPGTAVGAFRLARGLGRFALGADASAARARVGFDPLTHEPVSVDTSLDAQGRPANPLGAPPGEYGHELTGTQLGPGADYARQPGPAPHPDAPGAVTIHAVDGAPITDIHPARVTPESAAEIRDALKLGRVDPATLPRSVALARALNAVTPATVTVHSPEALEVRKQDAIAKEIARQDAANPNPGRDGTIAFVSGPPGAGKSNVVSNQLASELKAQVADLDALAQHFDGYNGGITKQAVHQEADRAMPDFMAQIADGRNLVVPIVGANPSKVLEMVQNARAAGYTRVYNFHVDVPTSESVRRTEERYERGGMYLPTEYAADPRLRERSRASFDAVKDGSNGYAAYDNNVPRGQAPKLTEASNGLPALLRELRAGGGAGPSPSGPGAAGPGGRITPARGEFVLDGPGGTSLLRGATLGVTPSSRPSPYSRGQALIHRGQGPGAQNLDTRATLPVEFRGGTAAPVRYHRHMVINERAIGRYVDERHGHEHELGDRPHRHHENGLGSVEAQHSHPRATLGAYGHGHRGGGVAHQHNLEHVSGAENLLPFIPNGAVNTGPVPDANDESFWRLHNGDSVDIPLERELSRAALPKPQQIRVSIPDDKGGATYHDVPAPRRNVGVNRGDRVDSEMRADRLMDGDVFVVPEPHSMAGWDAVFDGHGTDRVRGYLQGMDPDDPESRVTVPNTELVRISGFTDMTPAELYADETAGGGERPPAGRRATRPSDLRQEEYLGEWDRYNDSVFDRQSQREAAARFRNGETPISGEPRLIHVAPSNTGKGEIGFFLATPTRTSADAAGGPESTRLLLAAPVDAHGAPTGSLEFAAEYMDHDGSTWLGMVDTFKGRGAGPVFLAEAQKSLGRLTPGHSYTRQGEQNRRKAHRYDTIAAQREGAMAPRGLADYTNDPEVMKAGPPGGVRLIKGATLGITPSSPPKQPDPYGPLASARRGAERAVGVGGTEGPGAASTGDRGAFAKMRPGMDVDRAGDKLIGKGLDGKLTAADAEELLRFIARRTDLPARAVGTVETRLEEIVAAQDENAAGVIQVRKEFQAALKQIRADLAGAKAEVGKAATGLRNVGRDAMEQQRTITRQTTRATTAAGRALQERLAAASGQLATDTAQAASMRDAAAAAEPAVTGASTNEPVSYGGAINPKRPGVAENAAARSAHQAVVNAVQVKIDDSVRRLDALIKDTPQGEDAPAHKVAASLRRAATSLKAEIAALPKRGLVGERSGKGEQPPLHVGDLGRGNFQTDSQVNYGPGLTRGSNTYRPTQQRAALEKRIAKLEDAARAITDTRHELLLLDRQVNEADMSVADRILAAGRSGALDPVMAREYAGMANAGREGQALAAANRELDPEAAPLTYPDFTHVDELAEQRADAAARLATALEQARAIAPLDPAGNMAELARAISVELRNLRSAMKAIEPPELTEVPPLSEYAKQRGILRQGPKYHPDTYALIQEAVDANPDEYARRLQTLTFDEAVNDLAPNIGLAPERFRTMLAKRGELIGPAVAAKMAVELQAQRIALLARTEGRASDAYATEYAKFVGLVMDVTEGTSEVARTLGAQRIYAQASTARAIDAAHFQKAAEAKYKATAAASSAFDRAVAKAEEAAALAAAKAEAAHGDALLRIAADELVRRQAALEQARMMAESGRRALEQATTAYEAAKANADTRAEAARQAIIAKAVKAGISPDHVKVLGSFSPYEVEGMARYLGSVKPMLGGEMIYSSLINSMLSAPTSVIKHLNGTLFLQADRRMTELLQATITGPALAKLTGHAAVTSMSKLRPGLAAYIGALPRGVGHMFSTYNLGIDPTQTDIHASLVGRGPRIFKGWHLGDMFTLGTRAHIAQNAPFWAMERAISQTYFAYDDALVELQQALGREPSGAELNAHALDKLGDPHYIATIEPRVRDAAYGAGMMGRTSTATKLLSQAIGMAKVPASVPAIGGFPFLKAFVPFMGIADRIAVMALQRMPGFAIAGGIVTGHPELAGMGLAVEAINEINAIRNGDDAKASYQAARQLWAIAIGIPILGAVSALAAQGLITGSAPAKKSDYDQWIATGKQPFSVKLNNTWYRWDWLEPVAFMLKLGLSAEGAWNDPNAQTPDAKLLEFAGRAGKAVSDSTYLRAFGMVISAIANPGTPVANAVESTLVAIGNPMSGLSRQLAQTIDPLQRGTTNVVEALKATVPWLSQELPPKRDVFGNTVPNVDDPLLPWKGIQERPNPVADAFAEVQSHVPNFTMPAAETAQVGKDLKLDGHELIRFQELAGQAIYQQAQKVIDSQRYKGLGWDQRAKELEAAIREGHTLGKQQLARELMGIHLDPATGAPQYGTASPREKALAIGIGLSAAPGNYERLKLVTEWLPIVDKDPALADALDKQLRAASSQFASDGKLTLADFRKVAPYLPALEKIPEFDEGTPAQWDQYRAELAQYNQLNKLDPTHDRANAFRDTHPVLDNFMYLASHGGKNPGLADLIDQEPLLRRIPLPRDRS